MASLCSDEPRICWNPSGAKPVPDDVLSHFMTAIHLHMYILGGLDPRASSSISRTIHAWLAPQHGASVRFQGLARSGSRSRHLDLGRSASRRIMHRPGYGTCDILPAMCLWASHSGSGQDGACNRLGLLTQPAEGIPRPEARFFVLVPCVPGDLFLVGRASKDRSDARKRAFLICDPRDSMCTLFLPYCPQIDSPQVVVSSFSFGRRSFVERVVMLSSPTSQCLYKA